MPEWKVSSNNPYASVYNLLQFSYILFHAEIIYKNKSNQINWMIHNNIY